MRVDVCESYVHDEHGVVTVDRIGRRIDAAEAEPGDDTGWVAEGTLTVQFSYKPDVGPEQADALTIDRVERGIEDLTTFIKHISNE